MTADGVGRRLGMAEQTERCDSGRRVVRAADLAGREVRNPADERLGKVEDITLDTATGRVAYVVLSTGGFLGLGDRLLAIPWQIFQYDTENRRFILDVSKDTLRDAPGFDKDDWPDLSLDEYGIELHSYYECTWPLG